MRRNICSQKRRLATRMASINHLERVEEKFRSLKSNSADTLMSFYASCGAKEEKERHGEVVCRKNTQKLNFWIKKNEQQQ